MSGRYGLGLVAALCLTVFYGPTKASPSDSLGDREVHDKLVSQASNRCHDYKGAYAGPLQGMDVSLARSILDHHVLICPDPSLNPALAVVWYGNYRAITWNPAVAGSGGVLDQVIRTMAHADDFSDGIDAYDAQGRVMKGQLVPAFTTRCTDVKDCNG